MDFYIIAQAIGLIAFATGCWAFFDQNGDQFRVKLSYFQILMCIHFFFLDADVSAFITIIAALRTYISTKTNSLWIMSFFIVLIWVSGLYYLTNVSEILAMLGSSIGTYALFRHQGIQLRCIMLFNSLMWFINNLLLHSIGGSLVEGMFLIISLATIYQMKRKQGALLIH